MKDILIVILILLCLACVLHLPKDSLDPVDGRSGLSIRTDALTGCQYLSVYAGGIVPRVDKEGQHICKD